VPDFFDRFGDQLHAAQTAGSPVGPRGGRITRLLGRRSTAIAAVVAIIAPGAALAITQPWNPDLSRPGVDRKVSTDATSVSDAARGAFAVLRREQSASDRSGATPLIKAIGMGNQLYRVQLKGIRMVASGWALVPAKAAQTAPGGVTAQDQLCLTNGEKVGCANAQTAKANGVGLLTASKAATRLTGLVPDGVARVRFTPDSGSPVEVAVTGGFYQLTVPSVRSLPAIKAPPGSDGRSTIPGPPAPASGTLTWLDTSGKAVGPANPVIG
jgi:hypothetical protein